MSVMEVNGLTFAYPDEKEILHGIDLIMKEGEFVVLCGPSGCGKTTFLRCMKREIAPIGRQKGSITRHRAQEVGYVFQNPESQIVTDTVRHELSFGLENMGLPTEVIRRRVAETALSFGIDEWIDASVHEISGGQKQLLNLAAVIAMRPKLLLLDEPVSQLDPLARKNFLDVLVRVNRELGIAVLISEHYLEEILPLADRVIYMKDGSFQYKGTVQGYVDYVLKEEPAYFDVLPAAVRISYLLGKTGRQYPLTVREGRCYLMEYLQESKDDMEVRKNIEHVKEICKGRQFLKERKEGMERDHACLLVDHIWFQYQRQTPFILKGLTLRIENGEFHVILGGNGSGKTTLLSILGRRAYASRGKIRLGKEKKRPATAFLPQNPKAMFSRDSVKEELEAAECGKELAQSLKLADFEKQHPYDLSGGEQQRLGLAMVLAKKPDLLLLDEPTKGLDTEAKNQIGRYLREYTDQGHTVVCVTHDVEFAAVYADVCSLLFEGEILSTEPVQTFFEDNAFYTTNFRRIFRGL